MQTSVHFFIKQAETAEELKEYYRLRWKLLRAPWGKPKGSEVDDIEDRCLHFIAVETNNRDNIIAVARLQFNTTTEAQIRYMAVTTENERRGIGRRLIDTIETEAKEFSCSKIILDAREPAVGFYKKLGYQITEKTYLLFDQIQHFRMEKYLS